MSFDRFKAKHIILSICVILFAGWFYAYYFVFDVVEEEVHLGYEKKAKRYKYLAAEMYLDKKNIPSEYRLNYALFNNVDAYFDGGGERNSDVLTRDDTLILINAHGSISEGDVDVLWEWVNSGGTLVTSFENPYMGDERYDGFTEALDLVISPPRKRTLNGNDPGSFINETVKKLEESSKSLQNDAKAGEEKEGTAPREYSDQHRCDGGDLVILPVGSGAPEIRFELGDDFLLGGLSPNWTAEARTLPDDSGVENIEYRGKAVGKFSVGDGFIYVLRSTKLWQNATIQCADNALFLSKVVNSEGKAWFIENRHSPSLIALLLSYLPMGVALLFALLVFLLWFAFFRFGPQFSSRIYSRRQFSEHIRADSAFILRHKGYAALLAVLRNMIEARMKKKVFQYEEKTDAEKVRCIQKLVKFDEKTLWTTLFKPDVESTKEFVECVKVLQRLKGEL